MSTSEAACARPSDSRSGDLSSRSCTATAAGAERQAAAPTPAMAPWRQQRSGFFPVRVYFGFFAAQAGRTEPSAGVAAPPSTARAATGPELFGSDWGRLTPRSKSGPQRTCSTTHVLNGTSARMTFRSCLSADAWQHRRCRSARWSTQRPAWPRSDWTQPLE